MSQTKILLVDDEETFTRLLKLNLEQTGRFEVAIENWGGRVVAAAQAFRPDIILMDVIMPQMYGGDVAAMIRNDPTLQKIPIVFLSATLSKSRVDEHDGIIGGYPFLAKPATIEEIVAVIDTELAKR